MDQCIEKGCNLKIKLVRESDLFKIFWTYEGSVPFKNEIVIDKVRAVDSANDYVSKNSAVKIHSTTGEQILNLNQLWFANNKYLTLLSQFINLYVIYHQNSFSSGFLKDSNLDRLYDKFFTYEFKSLFSFSASSSFFTT